MSELASDKYFSNVIVSDFEAKDRLFQQANRQSKMLKQKMKTEDPNHVPVNQVIDLDSVCQRLMFSLPPIGLGYQLKQVQDRQQFALRLIKDGYLRSSLAGATVGETEIPKPIAISLIDAGAPLGPSQPGRL